MLSHALLFILVFFSVMSSIVITSLKWGRESLCVCLFIACINFCRFSLPLGARDWLQLMTVVLHGLFY